MQLKLALSSSYTLQRSQTESLTSYHKDSLITYLCDSASASPVVFHSHHRLLHLSPLLNTQKALSEPLLELLSLYAIDIDR